MTAIGPGMRIKCIKHNGVWRYVGTNAPGPGPEFGSVWTVDSIYEWTDGKRYLRLVGFVNPVAPENFVPVDEPDIEALRSLLTDIRDPDAERRKEIERADA